jgi:hypothetical protein
MDKKTLGRLFWIPKQIEQKRREIQRIWDRLTAISPNLSGMPHGGGVHDKIGEGVPELVAKKEELEEICRKLQKEEDQINDWIDHVDDLQIQLFISLRYKERMPWNEVAIQAGGNNSEDSVRMMVNRYLERGETDGHGEDAERGGKGRAVEGQRDDR